MAVATTTAEGAAGSEIVAERTERGERVKALIRRFLQVLVSGGGGAPEFIAGGLYLLGEVGIVIFAFSCFQNPSLVFVASLHCFLVLAITILSSFSQPKHPWSPVYSVLQIYRMLKRFFFFFHTAFQQCTRAAEHDQRPATTCFIDTTRQFLRPKKTRTPIRSCLCSPTLGASTYHPVVYLCRRRLICCILTDASPLALPPRSISARPPTPHKRSTHSVA